MKNVKAFLKKNYGYFLSFLIPLIILLLAFGIKGVTFWGPNSLVYSDMESQYLSFLSFLQNVLLEGKSLFYSFSNGLGGETLSIFTYYLNSPLNLLLLFFNKIDLNYFLMFLVLFKISLCGLTMFYFLKKSFPNMKQYNILIFSLSYSLMSFSIANYFNIIWFDVIYLLPLLLGQLDNIIDGKSSIGYGLILFLSILCNYYMSYIVCLFLCIYFIYKLFLKYNLKDNKKEMLDRTITFGMTSLLFGLMTFFLMYPNILVLLSTRLNVKSIFSDISFFNFIDVFSRIFIGTNDVDNMFSISGPYLYCGMLVLLLVLQYFLNDNISSREKKLSLTILLVFLVFSICNVLYYIWHAFSQPIGFNYRFSFIIVFFLILIAVRNFAKLSKNKKTYLIPLIIFIPISFIYLFTSYEYLAWYKIVVSLVLFILYDALLYFLAMYDFNKKKLINILIILLFVAELFLNSYLVLFDYQFYSNKEFNDYYYLNEKIKENFNDDEFFRYETSKYYTKNDSFLFDYNGMTNFNSTFNLHKNLILMNSGFFVGGNFVSFDYSTLPIIPSLLGFKYQLLDRESFYYNKLNSYNYSQYRGLLYGMKNQDLYLYENPYASNLMFLVDKEALNFNGESIDIFEYQNLILKTMLNFDEEVLLKHEVEKIDDNNYQIKITNDNPIYLKSNYQIGYDDVITIYINDELVDYYGYKRNNYLVLNNYEIGEVLNIRYEVDGKSKITESPIAYEFDFAKFKELMNEINKGKVELTSFNDTNIKASVDVSGDKFVLFTSIPYEEGWHAYVDSEEVDIVRLYDSMSGLILTEGHHDIEFVFRTPGIKTGIIVSFISLLGFIVYYFNRKKFNDFFINLYIKYEEIILYLVVGFLTTVVNIVAYAILARSMGIQYMVSTVLAWFAAVIFAYVTNKQVVFKSKLNTKEELMKEAYEFFKFRVISLAMEVMLMYLSVSMLNINDMIAKIFISFLVIVANYFFSKLFIFKKGD